MSSEVEAAFVAHLLDVDSMGFLAVEGFHPEVLPTPEIAQLWEYAKSYYLDSDGTQALSLLALSTYEVTAGRTWLDVVIDLGIDPTETPELTISDVVVKLKSQYVVVTTQRFNRSFAEDMAAASTGERLGVVQEAVGDLVRISMALTPRREHVGLIEGVDERLRAYGKELDLTDGLRLGIPEIDAHHMLIQPGELAILGAGAKAGKSLLSVVALVAEWMAGRRAVLYSLENALAMTLDRVVCAYCKIDSERWQRHECEPEEIERVAMYRDLLREKKVDQFILHPGQGDRDVASIMARATALEAQSVIIDQLSHLHHPNPKGKPRWEQVRDIIQSVKEFANGINPVPVLLFAQMSRDGVEAASRRGFYEMSDYAESSEIERSADFAMAMYQSRDMRTANMAVIQDIACRRMKAKSWNVDWYPSLAAVHVRSEFHFDQEID